MPRPRIKIPPSSTDKALDSIVIMGLVLLIALPFYYYGGLPDQIPTHFNAAGEPDAYGSKTSVWVLPIVGLLLAVGMMYLNRFPHLFNYTVSITEENAMRQYSKATRMMRVINVLLVFAFVYINYTTIQTALGHAKGLGNGVIIIFILGIFGTMFYYLFQPKKAE